MRNAINKSLIPKEVEELDTAKKKFFFFFHNCVITSAYRNVWASSHVGTCTVQTRRKSHMREALQCHRAMAGVMLVVVVPIQGENVPSALLVKSWSIYRWWTTNKYIYTHTYTNTKHIRGSPVPDLVFLFRVFQVGGGFLAHVHITDYVRMCCTMICIL